MKTDLASIKLGLRPDEAAAVIGSEELFREMVAAKWIAPVVKRHKLHLYDRGHIAAAWLRILANEHPPKLTQSARASALTSPLPHAPR